MTATPATMFLPGSVQIGQGTDYPWVTLPDLGSPRLRGEDTDRPFQTGVDPGYITWGERIITGTVAINGDNPDDALDKYGTLMEALAPLRNSSLIQTLRVILGDTDWDFNVHGRPGRHKPDMSRLLHGHIRLTFEWVCADPRFHEGSFVTDSDPGSLDSITDRTASLAPGGNTPGGLIFSITNTGPNTLSGFTVTVDTLDTGEDTFTYVDDLAVGDRIDVDATNRPVSVASRVYNSDTDTDLSAGVDWAASTWLELPHGQTSTITLSHRTGSATTVTFGVQAYASVWLL